MVNAAVQEDRLASNSEHVHRPCDSPCRALKLKLDHQKVLYLLESVAICRAKINEPDLAPNFLAASLLMFRYRCDDASAFLRSRVG